MMAKKQKQDYQLQRKIDSQVEKSDFGLEFNEDSNRVKFGAIDQ